MARLKKAPLIVIASVALLGGGFLYSVQSGLISPKTAGSAFVPDAAPLPTVAEATPVTAAAVALAPLPSTTKATVAGPEIRFQEMAWNSQTALNYANGGVYTTQGSLMEKHGVNLHIVWEDDVNKQMSALVNFAEALKKNPQPTEGAHFAALMGDGSAAMIGNIAKELAEHGAEAEVIGSAGYSRGEDQLMGPAEWKQNPQAARGSLVSVFMYDGDWNIVMKWAGENKIDINPDVKTYDPTTINFYSADDFVKAAGAYVDGVCEDRPVVRNGKRVAGETRHICINAVSTWTPADVTVAEKKGGLATIVSTKDYYYQMPNTIIGIKQWNRANKPLVVKMLAAMFEGGDQVKAYPQALRRGCEANSIIWSSENGGGRQSAEYWETYYKGVTKADKQGIQVSLGGSSVNNLQDNLLLYGLTGGANAFASTYTLFGNIAKQANPKLTILPVEKVLNTEYVQAVKAQFGSVAAMPADAPKKVEANTQITQKIGDRSYQINFDTGKASFSPDSMQQLTTLKDGLVVTGEAAIEVHGYTDNTGDPARNKVLSQSRAQAIKDWMIQQGVDRDRFVKVLGHGDEDPAASNETESGRAKNRRVGIVIGK